ncbi:response regulator transcription factor [Undibacterium sp. RTI2.1]|uniref:response regulator transcription factor n=1 Tax=unclassified Undibacterium TaxID=2630295 RepID=UPI002B23AF19|nr:MULTISPECIES: response regulator transcription factor [unclassified Undibacterium]MEB0030245.1 response regulator transcription factor [Undibacterium sp. RTI2.1]MEB0116869.1 response regulator transcription factor [Undibacterium sp. RTI2.2]MEB0229638.1 response regulator transcription factor [Undibacterium sp. 10I3]
MSTTNIHTDALTTSPNASKAHSQATLPEPHINALLVDDDADIRELLARYLEKFGIRCITVADGKAMRQQLATTQIDIILLDLMLPDEDGLSLLRGLRNSKDSQIPVLMLTARGESADRIIGLELGADDYVVKPFDTRELVSRIHTILRRTQVGQTSQTNLSNQISPHNNRTEEEITFHGWRLNCHTRQLNTPDNLVVPLSNAEFRLLFTFVKRPGQVLSRDQLLDIARGKSSLAFDRSIDLLVSRLRQKLSEDSRQPSMLKTIRGEGYMFQPPASASTSKTVTATLLPSPSLPHPSSN